MDPISFLRPTRKCDLTIVTDSKYAIGLLSQNWKPKVNQALVQRIKDRMADLVTQYHIGIHFLWSPGHSGIQFNEIVDQLAKAGAHQKIAATESAFFASLDKE
jgi:ribonuclease HI